MTHRVKEPDIWGLKAFGEPSSLEDFESRVAEVADLQSAEHLMTRLHQELELLAQAPEETKALAAEHVLWYLVAYLQRFNISLKDLT